MGSRWVKSGDEGGVRPSRRDVLRAAAAATLGAFPTAGIGSSPPEALPQPTTRTASPAPWWLGPAYPRSRVVEVDSTAVLSGTVVDIVALGEMLRLGVRVLVGARTDHEAWRAVLGSAQRIVLKFNQVGAMALGTSGAMVQVLLEALVKAGYNQRSIALVEAPRAAVRGLDTWSPEPGWGQAIQIGERREELANYLYQADAVINVPFLKTHQIAGMSGALKNLSHALLRHPARYHENRCSPYVGQVVGNKEVSSRLKLNVVNALRTVVRNGPEAAERDIVGHGGLLLGFDPVAVDAVGYELLLTQRRLLDIRGKLDVPYLAAAADCGVGRRASHALERVPVGQGA